MEFDTQVEHAGSFGRTLTITATAEAMEPLFVAAVRKVGRTAALPGFRPGKIPAALLQRSFAAKIDEEVINQVLDATLDQALEAQQMLAVSQPQVTLGVLHRGAIFTYSAAVEVSPEVQAEHWQGLKVAREAAELPDGAVDEALEARRKQAAQLVPVIDRTTVQEGDLVVLDFVGRIDGVPFPGGRGDNAAVELGAGDYLPGFAEGLLGATVPGECDVEVRFPDDYGATELAGRTAVFHMVCKELKARVWPALDDELAKDLGHDSLEALRQDIAASLQQQADERACQQRRVAAVEALVAAHPIEVPPAMVRTAAERMVDEMTANFERSSGRKLPALGPEQRAELLAGSQEGALFKVRRALLLRAVAKAAEVEVDEDAIDAYIDTMADDAGDEAQQMRDAFASAERRGDVRAYLQEQRAIDKLLEHAVDAP